VVRQIASLGGHPLPASVPPSKATVDPSSSRAAATGFEWQPLLIFGLVFVPAWLVYEIVASLRRQRGANIGFDDENQPDRA
jgi:hypothetical protein